MGASVAKAVKLSTLLLFATLLSAQDQPAIQRTTHTKCLNDGHIFELPSPCDNCACAGDWIYETEWTCADPSAALLTSVDDKTHWCHKPQFGHVDYRHAAAFGGATPEERLRACQEYANTSVSSHPISCIPESEEHCVRDGYSLHCEAQPAPVKDGHEETVKRSAHSRNGGSDPVHALVNHSLMVEDETWVHNWDVQ